jgi:hypothetical protein
MQTQSKLPFVCFNCEKVGNFASKFPYKNKNNEEYSSLIGYRKGKTKKKINSSDKRRTYIPMRTTTL